ncbi:hypothetical protein K456DRAFT_30638 [Colletotrichum gloeosporioides 23]|nr:hypothetical protein K456DRAFT_30638 [Colletotrichum gloeosporioides 23]
MRRRLFPPKKGRAPAASFIHLTHTVQSSDTVATAPPVQRQSLLNVTAHTGWHTGPSRGKKAKDSSGCGVIAPVSRATGKPPLAARGARPTRDSRGHGTAAPPRLQLAGLSMSTPPLV